MVSHDLYRVSLNRYRAALADTFGCRVEDWATNGLAVVERPADSPEKYVSMLVTFGTGTVLSVEPDYLELARSFRFEKHYMAFAPPSVAFPLTAAAEARGEKVKARGPNLGFLLGTPPAPPQVPPGLRLQHMDQQLREEWMPGGRFANALGDEPPGATPWRLGIAAGGRSRCACCRDRSLGGPRRPFGDRPGRREGAPRQGTRAGCRRPHGASHPRAGGLSDLLLPTDQRALAPHRACLRLSYRPSRQRSSAGSPDPPA